MGEAEAWRADRPVPHHRPPLHEWASSTRAELERIAAQLRSLGDAPTAAQGPLRPRPQVADREEELARRVCEARARLEAEADAARSQSDALVAGALAEAADAVRRADETRRERFLGSSAGRADRGDGAEVSTPSASTPALDLSPVAGRPGALPPSTELEIDLDAFLGAGEPPEGTDEAFHRFWSEVGEVPPVLLRLRRWAGRAAL